MSGAFFATAQTGTAARLVELTAMTPASPETAPGSPTPESPRAPSNVPAWLPYVLPMGLFLLLTTLEGQVPAGMYPWAYAAKVVLVTISLLVFRRAFRDELRFDARVLPLGILVGLAVFAEWILIDKWIPYPHLPGGRGSFNPNTLTDPAARSAFLAVRFYGLALLVPVMEELFWRSFLLRLASTQLPGPHEGQDWRSLPLGAFSWAGFAAVAVLFGLAHPEWLVAVICAVAYGLLLRATRSLFAVIVAHAVTNLALGIYVLSTGDWKYW